MPNEHQGHDPACGADRTPLSVLFDRYRKARLQNASRFTIHNYRSSLRRLEKCIGRQPVAGDLTRETIDAVMQDMQDAECGSLDRDFCASRLHSLRRFVEALVPLNAVKPSIATTKIGIDDVHNVAGGATSFTFTSTGTEVIH